VPAARVRHRVGAATSSELQPIRSASSHHNLLRFALKCLPLRSAAQIAVGEVMRVPAHPMTISRAIISIAPELPEILRSRRSLQPRSDLIEAFLSDCVAVEGRRSFDELP